MPDLPLLEAVGLAYRYQQEASEDDRDHWHNPLWRFCWASSGHPDLRGLDADDAFEAIDFVFEELDIDWSKLDTDYEGDAPINFVLAWDAIKVPPGSSPLRAAERLATSEPLLQADDVPKRRNPAYIKLLNCAAWLALIENGQFFLSQRVAGKLVGKSRTPGNRLLRLAVHDGFLEVVLRHDPNPRNRQATEYKFKMNRLREDVVARAERIIACEGLREASAWRASGSRSSTP